MVIQVARLLARAVRCVDRPMQVIPASPAALVALDVEHVELAD
jgi:hypothetical protein